LSGFDKNLSQASKIFFGCRNGEIILIPTYSILLGNPLLFIIIHTPQQQCQSYSPVVAAGAKTVMVAAGATTVDALADMVMVDGAVPF
jgi:hypothetical protein